MERKHVEDYASEDWLEAADRCQSCGAGIEVMLAHLTFQGAHADSATARVRCRHRDGCTEGEGWQEEEQTVGWGWEVRPPGEIGLLGERYPLYAWFLDVMPCLCCSKLIVSVPLLLFGSHGTLAFCTDCFTRVGLSRFLGLGSEDQPDA